MKRLLSAALALSLTSAVSNAALILSDNFNAPDNGNFDNSDQTGRREGLLGPDVQLRSSRIQHSISSNQLLLGVPPAPSAGSGRVRFHDVSNLGNWHDFAAGAAGAAILGDGGLRVQFDWIPLNNTNTNWVSFSIGIDGQAVGEPDTRVNAPGTDLGILFRHNGGSQYFDNRVPADGGTSAATTASRRVVMDFGFDSFADGSNVSLTASVDGTVVLANHVFQWADNNGALYMEFGSNESGTRIDNFSLSTIPEPSAAGLFALAGGAAVLRRRRK